MKCNKTAYVTKNKAYKNKKREEKRWHIKYEVYKCEYCKKYHFTTANNN